MRWPWTSRALLDSVMLDLGRYSGRAKKRGEVARRWKALCAAAVARAEAAEAQAEFLRKELDRAHNERADAQLKLLQVSYGRNPFVDETPVVQPVAQEETASLPPLGQTASAEQVHAYFTREALDLYGPTSLSIVKRHVEMRQAEYYAGRHSQPSFPVNVPPSPAQSSVLSDLLGAIDEGRAAAGE